MRHESEMEVTDGFVPWGSGGSEGQEDRSWGEGSTEKENMHENIIIFVLKIYKKI